MVWHQLCYWGWTVNSGIPHNRTRARESIPSASQATAFVPRCLEVPRGQSGLISNEKKTEDER